MGSKHLVHTIGLLLHLTHGYGQSLGFKRDEIPPTPVFPLNSPHELKLAVRRDEANGSFRLKLAELDTLMESAVIDSNSRLRVLATPVICKQDPIANITQEINKTALY